VDVIRPIYMCACLLLDPFQLFLKCQLCLAYPYIYIQRLQTAVLLGMKMCWWDFLGGGGVGEILIRR